MDIEDGPVTGENFVEQDSRDHLMAGLHTLRSLNLEQVDVSIQRFVGNGLGYDGLRLSTFSAGKPYSQGVLLPA